MQNPRAAEAISPTIEEAFMSKHLKTATPSDASLHGNPMIGGSKGTTIAGVTPDELEEFQGETTIEGDVANDTNRAGGIDKDTSLS
jgi:hypothetical protein